MHGRRSSWAQGDRYEIRCCRPQGRPLLNGPKMLRAGASPDRHNGRLWCVCSCSGRARPPQPLRAPPLLPPCARRSLAWYGSGTRRGRARGPTLQCGERLLFAHQQPAASRHAFLLALGGLSSERTSPCSAGKPASASAPPPPPPPSPSRGPSRAAGLAGLPLRAARPRAGVALMMMMMMTMMTMITMMMMMRWTWR